MSQKSPLVSIVIPCYQQGHFLAAAFASIAAQSYSTIEVIVVDDGTTVPVELPEGEWGFDVTLIRQPNGGLSAARNRGLAAAKGRWIKFLDADDILLPNCLSDQLLGLGCSDGVDSPNLIGVIGFIEEVEASGDRSEIYPCFGNPLEAALLINPGPPHIYIYPTQLLRDAGGFSCDARVEGGHEDYDLILRLLAAGATMVSLHRLGVIYFRRRGSMSSFGEAMARSRVDVWVHHLAAMLKAQSPLSESVLSAALTGFCQLAEVTPTDYLSRLHPAAELLASICRAEAVELPEQERWALGSRLQLLNSVCAEPLQRVFNREYSGTPTALSWSPQAVIDRRIMLSRCNGAQLSAEWLVAVLTALKENPGPFAIYGAGAIGRQLLVHLTRLGIKPECLFDQRWQEIEALEGISVLPLKKLPDLPIKQVILASFAYRDEIAKELSELCHEVKLVPYSV